MASFLLHRACCSLLAAALVTGTAGSLSAQIPQPPALRVHVVDAQHLPLPVSAIKDALPLLPGVIRSGTGELSFKGASEEQSGLRLNGMSAADPASGAFRLNLPVDAVEGVQVFLHPYTVEHGQFTGALT